MKVFFFKHNIQLPMVLYVFEGVPGSRTIICFFLFVFVFCMFFFQLSNINYLLIY